jgi:uncharacterized protein (DUF2164 family)
MEQDEIEEVFIGISDLSEEEIELMNEDLKAEIRLDFMRSYED